MVIVMMMMMMIMATTAMLDLQINGKPVRKVSRTKSVGVHIDQNLSWNVHIVELSKKIASGIEALNRVRHFVHTTTLQYIFNYLIQPYFNYCCVAWVIAT